MAPNLGGGQRGAGTAREGGAKVAMFPGFKGGQGLGMFQESRESLTSMEAPTLQHKLLMLSCLPPPCSAQVSQGREEVFLAAGQPGFGKARAVSTPCFYIFMPIQNVPFWAGLSQASPLVCELMNHGEGNSFEKGEFFLGRAAAAKMA